jgi:hypothetical protein
VARKAAPEGSRSSEDVLELAGIDDRHLHLPMCERLPARPAVADDQRSASSRDLRSMT